MSVSSTSIDLVLREFDQTRIQSLPAFAILSVATPLWVSGLLMALLAIGLKLTVAGYHADFASQFAKEWMVMWALAFPFSYVIAEFIRDRRAENLTKKAR